MCWTRWLSLDAVEAAIRILEDDPLFNAGRGSDFAADGRNEMDAAIMDGSNLKAGAVGDVTRTRHPISLARAVMEKSPHVFLVGEGPMRSQSMRGSSRPIRVFSLPNGAGKTWFAS